MRLGLVSSQGRASPGLIACSWTKLSRSYQRPIRKRKAAPGGGAALWFRGYTLKFLLAAPAVQARLNESDTLALVLEPEALPATDLAVILGRWIKQKLHDQAPVWGHQP